MTVRVLFFNFNLTDFFQSMEPGSVEALEEKIALESDCFEKVAIQDDDEEVCYGELILLG